MRELRCIIFSNQELISAIIDFKRKNRMTLPIGTVSGCEFIAQDEVVITKITLTDDYKATSEMLIDATEVAAAVVNYCLERKVPIARSYTKKLEVMDGQLTLVMTMTVDTGKSMKHQGAKAAAAPHR
jgi:hypothetical protein